MPLRPCSSIVCCLSRVPSALRRSAAPAPARAHTRRGGGAARALGGQAQAPPASCPHGHLPPFRLPGPGRGDAGPGAPTASLAWGGGRRGRPHSIGDAGPWWSGTAACRTSSTAAGPTARAATRAPRRATRILGRRAGRAGTKPLKRVGQSKPPSRGWEGPRHDGPGRRDSPPPPARGDKPPHPPVRVLGPGGCGVRALEIRGRGRGESTARRLARETARPPPTRSAAAAADIPGPSGPGMQGAAGSAGRGPSRWTCVL